MYLLLLLEKYSTGQKVVLGIVFLALLWMFLHYAIKMIEMVYVMRHRKPLYFHFHPFLKRLGNPEKTILRNNFSFYTKLTDKQKGYFEHRVASFIQDKHFIGRNGVAVTIEIQTLISATAVMLTFGFRDFYIGLIQKIVVYPNEFYSKLNKKHHKGEFNPKLKTLVFSWEDFKHGYDISNDKLNLGIHEFAHAIHLNSMKERDVSSTLFSDSFKELTELITNKEMLRKNLRSSKYFRDYAFTNQYEFIAVIIETFIETPSEFRNQFPEVYNKTKQMLNFDFAGY
jgi:Mlc titration factor MtfA (ptsG expression regulator)